jgi:hypothetical protein
MVYELYYFMSKMEKTKLHLKGAFFVADDIFALRSNNKMFMIQTWRHFLTWTLVYT